MRVGTTLDYFLYASDPENDNLTFSYSTSFPDYTFVAPNKIVMSPTSVGAWCSNACVSDGTSSTCEHFDLNIMPLSWSPTWDSAPYFTPALTAKSVREGFTLIYTIAATDELS